MPQRLSTRPAASGDLLPGPLLKHRARTHQRQGSRSRPLRCLSAEHAINSQPPKPTPPPPPPPQTHTHTHPSLTVAGTHVIEGEGRRGAGGGSVGRRRGGASEKGSVGGLAGRQQVRGADKKNVQRSRDKQRRAVIYNKTQR